MGPMGLFMYKPMDQQKRLFMYVLILATKQYSKGIRVEEMLTNDHSITSVTNFLLSLEFAKMYLHAPRKFETDFSFAMIKTACKAFNSRNLPCYLNVYLDSVTQHLLSLTMPHNSIYAVLT